MTTIVQRLNPAAVAERHEQRVRGRDLCLLSTAEVVNPDGRILSLSCNFLAVPRGGDLAPDDPDGTILDVGWFPHIEAIARIRKLPYTPISVPAAGNLCGTTTRAAHWRFRLDAAGEFRSWTVL